VKYMLLIELDPELWNGMSETEQNEVFTDHGAFVEAVESSGELVATEALTDPSNSAVVRVRDNVRRITEGPFVSAGEFVAGYYVVDVETRERALELAAMIPDARFSAIEVRPVMGHGGTEL